MFTGSHYIVEIRPPQLISEISDTKELRSHDDFQLVCESDKPIDWYYPRFALPTEEVQFELFI